MKLYFRKIKVFISSTIFLVLPYFALADSPAFNNLKNVGEVSTNGNAPYLPITDNGVNSLAGIIGVVIQAFLGLLGIIFLAYLLLAGYSWMTAQGDEEKVTKAKDTIARAVIGVIVIVASYAISYFIFDKLLTGTGILK